MRVTPAVGGQNGVQRGHLAKREHGRSQQSFGHASKGMREPGVKLRMPYAARYVAGQKQRLGCG